jgi:hypothetical protein
MILKKHVSFKLVVIDMYSKKKRFVVWCREDENDIS